MEQTPQSNRLHVSIFGETNTGKSSLFNAILGTQTAIVSEISGTTTDSVAKSMELLPFGPIVLTDTAGLNDTTWLSGKRLEKTMDTLNRTDFALYTIDINNFNENEYEKMSLQFDKHIIPHLIVITKKDQFAIETLAQFSKKYENSIVVSIQDKPSIDVLKAKIAVKLDEIAVKRDILQGGVLKSGEVAIMVVPIDSAAPKGRLILPQVQFLRECLDNGARVNVTTLETLAETIEQTKKIDLIVTDSQIFAEVAKIAPREIPLTSFSILLARQKGDLKPLIDGLQALNKLKDGDVILIAEVCTHTTSHEDIGQVKIPKLLKKLTGKQLMFEFSNGKDFPLDANKHALIVHCGGCMVTSREMQSRLIKAAQTHVPITNYGVLLAFGSGILDRSVEMFV